jgi:hypothetical protein
MNMSIKTFIPNLNHEINLYIFIFYSTAYEYTYEYVHKKMYIEFKP